MNLAVNDLMIGDVIQLNSGGPLMTVTGFYRWGTPFAADDQTWLALACDSGRDAQALVGRIAQDPRLGVGARWFSDKGTAAAIFDLRIVKRGG